MNQYRVWRMMDGQLNTMVFKADRVEMDKADGCGVPVIKLYQGPILVAYIDTYDGWAIDDAIYQAAVEP